MLSLSYMDTSMKGATMMEVRDFPTYGEMFAIEHAARRAQAAELSRLIGLGFRKLVALARKTAGALSNMLDLSATGGGSGNTEASTTLTSIMEGLYESLPEDVRKRYAEELATAVRVAPVLDMGFAAWEFGARVIAQLFRGIARTLRASARGFDIAARRLMPMP